MALRAATHKEKCQQQADTESDIVVATVDAVFVKGREDGLVRA